MKANYLYDDHDYSSLEDIDRRYSDYVKIWVAGSTNYLEKYSDYYILLQYKEHREVKSGRIEGTSSNRAALVGIKKALEGINNPTTVCVIDTTLLGFKGALHEEGVNWEYALSVLDDIVDKRCKLIEVCWGKSSPKLKHYILQFDTNGDFHKIKRVEDPIVAFKKQIYDECIEKVVNILNKHEISNDIIEEIKAL